MIQNEKIAIIGGGPGGLTLARLLQNKGLQVKVYERDVDRHVRQQGATLDLHEASGLRALEVAGLMPEFKKHYRAGADRMRVTDKNATILLDDHLEKPEADFGSQAFRPEIDRGPLRDILIHSLAEGTVVWDAQFAEMELEGNGWQLHFKNGSSAYADLVIGCDGANSRLRPYITNIKPIYSGITIVEGNIYHAEKNAPVLNALLKGGKVFALGSEKSIILSAKGDGSLSFYTGTKETEDWAKASGLNFEDRAQMLHWFRQRFADWAAVWQELFGSDDSYVVPRPMYHFPLNQQWQTLPNLTMIGDAAHRMPPYAGEGVNMAMLDALELYEHLTDPIYTDLKSALHTFETGMCRRSSEVTRVTLEQTEALHAPNGLTDLLQMFNAHGEQ